MDPLSLARFVECSEELAHPRSDLLWMIYIAQLRYSGSVPVLSGFVPKKDGNISVYGELCNFYNFEQNIHIMYLIIYATVSDNYL